MAEKIKKNINDEPNNAVPGKFLMLSIAPVINKTKANTDIFSEDQFFINSLDLLNSQALYRNLSHNVTIYFPVRPIQGGPSCKAQTGKMRGFSGGIYYFLLNPSRQVGDFKTVLFFSHSSRVYKCILRACNP